MSKLCSNTAAQLNAIGKIHGKQGKYSNDKQFCLFRF